MGVVFALHGVCHKLGIGANKRRNKAKALSSFKSLIPKSQPSFLFYYAWLFILGSSGRGGGGREAPNACQNRKEGKRKCFSRIYRTFCTCRGKETKMRSHTHTLLSLLLLSITASAHVCALYEQIAANDLTLQGKPSMQPYLGERK